MLLLSIFMVSYPLTEAISMRKYPEYHNYRQQVPPMFPLPGLLYPRGAVSMKNAPQRAVRRAKLMAGAQE